MYNKYKISKFNLFFLSLLFTLSFILPALATDNSLDGELLLAASSRRIANPISMGRFSLASVPAYSGKPYAVINKNVPFFTKADRVSRSYEKYSQLDNLGRCGAAMANVGRDLMPTTKRGKIGQVKPSGWHLAKYDCVDGKYLYNRCHLIGYQLTAENANPCNLITGTRYLNVQGMLPFENMVADYVKETGKHVLYRVTPVFKGNNLVAHGVLMEAMSTEDGGRSVLFNVYCYNVQPQISINYKTGTSTYTGGTTVAKKQTQKSYSSSSQRSVTKSSSYSKASTSSSSKSVAVNIYVLNNNTHKFHRPGCSSAARISSRNREEYTGSRSSLISDGYSPCKKCNP